MSTLWRTSGSVLYISRARRWRNSASSTFLAFLAARFFFDMRARFYIRLDGTGLPASMATMRVLDVEPHSPDALASLRVEVQPRGRTPEFSALVVIRFRGCPFVLVKAEVHPAALVTDHSLPERTLFVPAHAYVLARLRALRFASRLSRKQLGVGRIQ